MISHKDHDLRNGMGKEEVRIRKAEAEQIRILELGVRNVSKGRIKKEETSMEGTKGEVRIRKEEGIEKNGGEKRFDD